MHFFYQCSVNTVAEFCGVDKKKYIYELGFFWDSQLQFAHYWKNEEYVGRAVGGCKKHGTLKLGIKHL